MISVAMPARPRSHQFDLRDAHAQDLPPGYTHQFQGSNLQWLHATYKVLLRIITKKPLDLHSLYPRRSKIQALPLPVSYDTMNRLPLCVVWAHNQLEIKEETTAKRQIPKPLLLFLIPYSHLSSRQTASKTLARGHNTVTAAQYSTLLL